MSPACRSPPSAKATEPDQIVELGSGSAKKTRELLAACQRQRPTTYLPVDVSREMLELSGRTLSADVPGLTVIGLRVPGRRGVRALAVDAPVAPGGVLVCQAQDNPGSAARGQT